MPIPIIFDIVGMACRPYGGCMTNPPGTPRPRRATITIAGKQYAFLPFAGPGAAFLGPSAATLDDEANADLFAALLGSALTARGRKAIAARLADPADSLTPADLGPFVRRMLHRTAVVNAMAGAAGV